MASWWGGGVRHTRGRPHHHCPPQSLGAPWFSAVDMSVDERPVSSTRAEEYFVYLVILCVVQPLFDKITLSQKDFPWNFPNLF